MMPRSEALTAVRKVLSAKFPRAVITTNDDANPATPMSVKATWSNGRIWKVVRANSIATTAEEFASAAVVALEKYQAANLRDAEQPE